ncbi:uncharacterized protein LOC118767006 [Octopus sinensis]|uniref:Uncharacterized protein LOC118767006 n=1 Tax=Octopus sinensis TaxID=2607531 RepID=A0A7E6FHG7_9MOLL|nr:uncharacterized protein LOC118767006 [Octopus sinensis]
MTHQNPVPDHCILGGAELLVLLIQTLYMTVWLVDNGTTTQVAEVISYVYLTTPFGPIILQKLKKVVTFMAVNINYKITTPIPSFLLCGWWTMVRRHRWRK